MYLTLGLILGFITYSSASKCCFPAQYEAVQGLMRSTVKNGRLSILYGTLSMVFDANQQKAAFDENLTVDGVNTNVKVIQDFPSRKKYVISGGHCTQKALLEFKRGCVPDSATVLTEADFGENGFRSVVYDTSSTGQSSFLLTQKDNCYPFMDVSAAPSGPEPYMQIVAFMNVTAGIKHPSALDIPDICKQAGPVGK